MPFSITRHFAIAVCASFTAFDAHAQTYPVKPVRLVIGFAAGGGADMTARLVGQKLGDILGQNVIIENRPGAGSATAIARTASAPGDGYTLLMITSSGVAQSALRANLPYDLERDFTPVSLMAVGPLMLVVHPAVPVKNVKELIALARSRPGRLNYGSAGAGSTPHLTGELLKYMAKLDIVHVPFKGGSENVTATAAGEIDMSFATVPAVLPFMEAGKLKVLAITTSKRASFIPKIPTISESGLPGYDLSSWYGVLAPAGSPVAVVARLTPAIDQIVNTPDMKDAFNKQGLEPQTVKAADFGAYIRTELAKNAKLISLAKVKVEQ